jgi:transporter family-2 protein
LTFIYLGCNAKMTKFGGRSFSALLSFTLGTLCCLIFFGIDIGALDTPLPSELIKGTK